jgi:hypothetical protein
MEYKEAWDELKLYLKDSLKHMDELAFKYFTEDNKIEYGRISTKRNEYKNIYRKVEEIEKNINK